MKNLRRIILTKAYRDIQKGKMSEALMFKTLETYFKVSLTEDQKDRVRMYARQIQNNEMSLEDFLALSAYKEHNYETNR